MTDPKTTDYCLACGESPESGRHLFGHEYVDPRKPPSASEAFAECESLHRHSGKRMTLREAIQAYVKYVYEQCGNNLSRAARELGISRFSVKRWISGTNHGRWAKPRG